MINIYFIFLGTCPDSTNFKCLLEVDFIINKQFFNKLNL